MKSYLSTSLAAALTLGTLAVMALPQTATARMTACQIRHSYCSERCIMRNTGSGIDGCISRTCDHQNRGCGPESLPRGRGLAASTPKTPSGPVTAPIERGNKPGPVASGSHTQGPVKTAPIERGGRR